MGAGACGGHLSERSDPECFDLTQVMAQRMGIVAGIATLLIVLTMVGLQRLSSELSRRDSRH